MFERDDRSVGSNRSLLLAAAIGVVIAASAAGGYWWFRSAGGQLPVKAPDQTSKRAEPVRPDETVSLTLYVPGSGSLETIAVGANRQPDLQLEARDAIAAILAADRGGRSAVLKELRLRAFYLDPTGTGFVDLSLLPGQREVRASAWEELLAVYAIVNTLAQNFPEVKQVRLLVDGREAQTLAGHVDLARNFVRRQDLVKAR